MDVGYFKVPVVSRCSVGWFIKCLEKVGRGMYKIQSRNLLSVSKDNRAPLETSLHELLPPASSSQINVELSITGDLVQIRTWHV
jgi:hypothetical protein